MNSKKKCFDIKKLVSILINNETNQTEVVHLIQEIHKHFQDITNISGYDTQIKHLAAVPTTRGMALSLNHAAQCLLDYKRTAKFLKGIVSAVREKQQNHPGQIIRILYAGCGPYAPFVTLIAPLFKTDEVQFSLLEINNDSLDSAKKLIIALEQTSYIQAYHLADAVTFKIPSPDTFDILISETLDALLYRESYVPILFNMLPQLSDEIILIPDNVIIKTTWLKNQRNNSEKIEFQELDTNKILDVRQSVALYNENPTPIPIQLPSKRIKQEATHTHLLIDTEVYIYDDLILKRGESSLTIPYEMNLENPLKSKDIIFTYHLEPQVELKYELQ